MQLNTWPSSIHPILLRTPLQQRRRRRRWRQLDEASRVAALGILARLHRPHVALGQIEEGGKR